MSRNEKYPTKMSDNTICEYSREKERKPMQQADDLKIQSQKTREKKNFEQSNMNDDDLYEYMFNHVAFDEIPYDKDPFSRLYRTIEKYIRMRRQTLNMVYMKTY